MYRPNLQSAALPVPEIIAIAVLSCGLEPPILGRGGRRVVGYGTVRKSVMISYRPSVSLSVSIRD